MALKTVKKSNQSPDGKQQKGPKIEKVKYIPVNHYITNNNHINPTIKFQQDMINLQKQMEFALLNNQPTDHIQMELQQLQAEFFKGKMKRGTDGSSTTTASTNQIG